MEGIWLVRFVFLPVVLLVVGGFVCFNVIEVARSKLAEFHGWNIPLYLITEFAMILIPTALSAVALECAYPEITFQLNVLIAVVFAVVQGVCVYFAAKQPERIGHPVH